MTSDPASSAPPTFPGGLVCPGCRGPINWRPGGGACVGCGRKVAVLGGRIPDFLGGECRSAEQILGWPGVTLPRIAAGVGPPPPPDLAAELEALGLADRDGRLTRLGGKLAYHLAEYRRQSEDDRTAGLLDRVGLGPGARVLDVGCGAGQTLRLVGPRLPGERVGVDTDAEALALGRMLADAGGDVIGLARASGEALPFGEGRFTHVLCRVALNYMHQRRSLGEMARVLEPGGSLYCRVEGPGFDLGLIRRAGGARELAGRVWDFALGCALALAGRQPRPGGRVGGGRVFGSARRVGRFLDRVGCELVRVDVLSRRLGLPTGFELVARRHP